MGTHADIPAALNFPTAARLDPRSHSIPGLALRPESATPTLAFLFDLYRNDCTQRDLDEARPRRLGRSLNESTTRDPSSRTSTSHFRNAYYRDARFDIIEYARCEPDRPLLCLRRGMRRVAPARRDPAPRTIAVEASASVLLRELVSPASAPESTGCPSFSMSSQSNPARRLYERNGFHRGHVGAWAADLRMEWYAAAGVAAISDPSRLERDGAGTPRESASAMPERRLSECRVQRITPKMTIEQERLRDPSRSARGHREDGLLADDIPLGRVARTPAPLSRPRHHRLRDRGRDLSARRGRRPGRDRARAIDS